MNANNIDSYQSFRASIQNTGSLLEEFSKKHNDFLFRQSSGLLDRSEMYYDVSVLFLDSEINLGNIKGSGNAQEDMEKIYAILKHERFIFPVKESSFHSCFFLHKNENRKHDYDEFYKQLEKIKNDFLDFCDKKFDDFLPDVIREYKPEWERDER